MYECNILLSIVDVSLGLLCFAVTLCDAVSLAQIRKLRPRKLTWPLLGLSVSQKKTVLYFETLLPILKGVLG